MRGFLVVRGLFVLAVVYAAVLIHPVDAPTWVNASVGLAVAVAIAFAEARLHDAAATSVLGGLLGFSVGLATAKAIGSSLFWANTSDTRVQFFHSLVILILPYLGLVTGARKGEWLEPAKLASLFRDTRPARRHRLLDTSVIIDGRVVEIIETGFLDGTLVVPQFVLKELQFIADSPDSLKRNRGRRGLDILHKIQKMNGVEVVISDLDFPSVKDVDMKLIELARSLAGKIVTNDVNLNKVAQLRGIEVLNINELAASLKPVVLPGELMHVFISKEGKEPNQGVAYLDDGTMVVVDHARKLIGRNLDVAVTSVLQTTAGRMIFGRILDHQNGNGAHPSPEPRPISSPRPAANA
jgi:uncharacterized protein YacL